ncbi:hypothetical protein SCLCIDRAFT_1217234 [Scleroderma citrinum Foug A]|uniref:Uncharacterized protein n=1 Tax=Scleroderma citrinum Foug A TaxID=1036808 RepID=A0A0C3A5I2_9AGAM|nr:hypothetical protein SCLCIDRAFT_1217234 [Scleroderma citrinum Foug A]
MDNSKAQSPCLVAAYAQGVCSKGTFSVDPLLSTYHYLGPSVDAANSCECNSITYNLMAACSACQNGSYVNWSSWSTNCSTIYLVYPEEIPSGTAIPHWAYQDVSTSDRFNMTLAQLARDASESTAIKTQAITVAVPSNIPTASLTSGGSQGTITQSPTSSLSSSSTSTVPLTSGGSQETITQALTSSPSSSPKSTTGAIMGGVVGGIVGGIMEGMFVGISAFIIWFCVRRCRQTKPPSAMYDGPTLGGTTTSLFVPPATHLTVYDPSDPSTFPTSLVTNYQNNSIRSNIFAAQSGRPGSYRGVPEI